MTQPDKGDKKNDTYQKPLSLFPMTMDEALAEVLKVKPPPKDDKKKPAKKTSSGSR